MNKEDRIIEILIEIRDLLKKPEPKKDTKEEEKMKLLEEMGKEDYKVEE